MEEQTLFNGVRLERWCIANKEKAKNELLVMPDSLRKQIDEILSCDEDHDTNMSIHALLRAVFTSQRDRISDVPIGMHW